ncbi:Sec translocon accessory complex subunit SecD [Gammaproteobacteria bacterium]
MNQYPLWKYILIVIVLVIGTLYALPNIFGEDPAIQITANARGLEIGQDTLTQLTTALGKARIEVKQAELVHQGLLVRLYDIDAQLKAQDVALETLGRGYVVALNLAPATPRWLSAIGAAPMYLGLDLRGGVHFLMQVDMKAVIDHAEDRYVSDARAMLRDKKLRYLMVGRASGGGLEVKFKEREDRDQALDLLRKELHELQITAQDGPDGFRAIGRIPEKELRTIAKTAVQQNLTTLRNRVNELGVAEPVLQQHGEDRVVVQLPGVQDTARAKEILGATATLEFRMMDEEHDPRDAIAGHSPPASKLYYERNGRPILLQKRVLLTGESVIDAASGIESQSGSPAVFITLDSKGARIFSQTTRELVGKRMAVVFIESKVETKTIGGRVVKEKKTVEEVINVAVIRSQLGKRFQVSGLDNTGEARNLALLLRAGALAAPMEIVEERTIGPSLGQDNIAIGVRSAVIGSFLVVVFMMVYYGLFGLIANVALLLNVVLVMALLSIIQSTLTLPGIAGITLTVGMAVDANVLINERIREELRNGSSPQASISAGYDKAFLTILDAHVTSLIGAIALFMFGTGPIKGFAVTLSLGILTSLFTAIMVTRAIVNLTYGRRRVARLSV